MPVPVLLIERQAELGREPVASDFTLHERLSLKESLRWCIQGHDERGCHSEANHLREVWDRCVGLTDAPRFEPKPELVDQYEAVQASFDLADIGARDFTSKGEPSNDVRTDLRLIEADDPPNG